MFTKIKTDKKQKQLISSLLPDFAEFEGFEITDGFGIKELKDMFRDIIKANKENAKPEGHRHGFEEFTGLKKFEVSEGNDELASEDGVLFDKDKKTLLKYPAGKADEEFTVPEGVETIAPHAFDGCKNLKKVELPESVKEIGKGAFEDVEDDEEVNLADLAALKMKLVGRDKVLGPKPAEDILAVEETEVTEDAAE
ncbi:MAG: leucine-rich repeat domain-containing protein [Oscillospiraceae bacterium]|nr:leucine-rich repeat domain-containing protein [Oscillospiraceae bacterium]